MPLITICRYRSTRHWAVYLGDELLAVTVYRKGARSIAQTLQNLHARIPALPTTGTAA